MVVKVTAPRDEKTGSGIQTGDGGGEEVKCPRCGADNADRAEWCYLCEYPFAPGSGEAVPPAPDEAATAQYPPPGEVPPGQQAVPPPPVGGVAYQPPPPGAYAPGYQPPPPPSKGPVTVKAIIGVLILVVIVVLAVGAYFFLRSDYYKIEVSIPPGYKQADDYMISEVEELMESELEDFELDYLWIDDSMSNVIFIYHMDIPAFSTGAPPSDDPDEMEEWFYENEEEWVDEFETGAVLQGGLAPDTNLYQVERLTTGDAVLHMAMSMNMMNTPYYTDILVIIKGDTAFFIRLEGLSNNLKTVEFLEQNITFEK